MKTVLLCFYRVLDDMKTIFKAKFTNDIIEEVIISRHLPVCSQTLKSFLEIVRRAVEKNNLKRTYAQKCQQ
jgi:hypothetical protein